MPGKKIKNLLEERAYHIWFGTKTTYSFPNRNYKPRDWKRLTNIRQNTWHIIRPVVMEVVGSIPTWNFKSLSRCQAIVTYIIHPWVHSTPFHISCKSHRRACSVSETHCVNKNPVKQPNSPAQWLKRSTSVEEVTDDELDYYLEVWNLFSCSRVSMGLTVSRKTAKNLAVRRKNETILTVSRKKMLTVKKI